MAPKRNQDTVFFSSIAVFAISGFVYLQNAFIQNPAKPQGKPAAQKPATAFEQSPVEEDAALVAKINQSILRGERWLLRNQGREGSWQNEERSSRIGYTELALFALTASAEAVTSEAQEPLPRGKPPAGKLPGPKPGAEPTPEEHSRMMADAIARGFEYVKKNPKDETYALSLLLLALDNFHAPRWERTALAKMTSDARKRYRFPRSLTVADKNWIDATLRELVEHRFKGAWSYTKNPGTGDISNTQFALLGLRAAANCGVYCEPKVWDDSLDYFLKFQDSEGPKFTFPVLSSSNGRSLEILSIDAMQRSWGYSFAKGGRETVKAPPQPRQKDKPVFGWSFGATGTHTSIGIASLQIIRDEYTRSLQQKKELPASTRLVTDRDRIDQGIRDGIAWLGAHWNLEEDPGGGFPFYYLYSVERVGALLGDRFIAGHDWYREGAEILLRRQLKDGAWPSDIGEVNAFGSSDVTATSFALLFLRRATTPGVITPDFGPGRK